MIDISTVKIALPLKKKFVVSKGGADVKTNLLALLNNRYAGEASGSVYYGPSVEILQRELTRGVALLGGQNTITAETMRLVDQSDIHPAAKSALSAMILHYVSGETRRYPWEILELATPLGINSSFTIAIDEPPAMLNAIRESSCPIVKVKMGQERDQELLEAFKEITDKEIRVDANGGWSCERAEEMIYYLAKSGVRVIEQPTDREFVKEWPYLKGKIADEVELIIDEGLATVEDYEQVKSFVDGINIKMEKSGGILGAVALADKANEDGKIVMLGCMVESSVGIAQSVYMSSLADYFDLDGPQLLEDDIASGLTYQKGQIQVDREIIGGPSLRRQVLEKYVVE